ncbi:MAG: PspC domain-containing protein [Bacteroidetes bacterium]|nr:PspC domain-containing protein [Bacteroidota bacterium]MBS1671400.1 PspC domain-containing protein [Bacteroidota bacterium]
MKKVININFQGRVVPIEESAYDILKKYIESLRNFFANEEGRDEIINDIEGRIAELFGETLKKGSTCIADDDVNTIIASIGRPEDFDDEEANVKSQLGGEKKQTENNANNNTSSQQTYTNEGDKRLYRDENNKVVAGVCSGIANHFNIDPTIIRILAVIFFGAVFLPYIILWVVIPSSATKVIGSQRKRLFRDTEDKVIAGVCSGLAQYFHVSVWVPRLLFLIPFFSFVLNFGRWHFWNFPDFMRISFSPGSAFIYIVLWLVLPEAKSTADKLEMKGEKVDLNSIKNTIQSDLEGIGSRAKKWGEDLSKQASEMGKDFSQKAKQFSTEATEKGKQFATEASAIPRKHGSRIGDFIVLIFKIFFYFIFGCILFAIVCALFAVGVVVTGLIPAWSFIIADGWQTILAWGTLVLFVWVPVIGIVTWIIRKLAGKKRNSKTLGFAFGSLWTVGWICIILLIASLSKDFGYRNIPSEENIVLTTPAVKQLEVKMDNIKYYDEEWYRLQPFASLDEDTAYVRNVRIRITKSKTDSFSVKIVKLANGKNRNIANNNASKVDFNITQTDSVLTLGKGIAINRKDKFRNQHVIITIAVPVGKKIKLNDNLGWDDRVYVGFGNSDWNWDDEDGVVTNWRHNVWYVMSTEGKLKRVDNIDDNDNNNTNNTDDNDAENNAIENYKKSREEIQKQREQKIKELNEIDKQLNQTDSSKYRYQPAKPQKPQSKQTALLSIKKMNMNFLFIAPNLLLARVI